MMNDFFGSVVAFDVPPDNFRIDPTKCACRSKLIFNKWLSISRFFCAPVTPPQQSCSRFEFLNSFWGSEFHGKFSSNHWCTDRQRRHRRHEFAGFDRCGADFHLRCQRRSGRIQDDGDLRIRQSRLVNDRRQRILHLLGRRQRGAISGSGRHQNRHLHGDVGRRHNQEGKFHHPRRQRRGRDRQRRRCTTSPRMRPSRT